jgi:hypothetical protein
MHTAKTAMLFLSVPAAHHMVVMPLTRSAAQVHQLLQTTKHYTSTAMHTLLQPSTAPRPTAHYLVALHTGVVSLTSYLCAVH